MNSGQSILLLKRLKFLLLLIFLSSTSSVFAQIPLKNKTSLDIKIYKLDQTQFMQIQKYQREMINDSIGLFTTHFFKSLPIEKSRFLDSLPFGHYFLVSSVGKRITFKTYSKSYFKIQSFGYNNEIWHIITDQEDNVIKEATVSIKDKEFNYQPDCNCYSTPAKRMRDTLKITYLNYYDFYKISSNYLQKPAYQETSNEYQKENRSNVRILPGYVAFNQPKYRKNDTVRVKAFLVNEKGKPWRKKKVLLKYKTPSGKTVVLGKVKRQSEGAYVKDFVLSESFRLGTYELSFWKTWDEVMLRKEPFQVEDYQLNPSNTYDAQITQKVYHRGQDVEFILKAVDVNGLALLDAKAKVTIQADRFYDFYDKFFYWNGKPDSYRFEKEVLFDVAGETVVTFPDSLFPNVHMRYKAYVSYSNDLGNLYNRSFDVYFDAKPNHFEFKLKGDSLMIDHFTLGVNSPYSKLELISMRKNEIIESKFISAPYREKIDLFNTRYILKDGEGKEIKRIGLNASGEIPVYLVGNRTHDSITVELKNELQMPVSYQVFKRGQKIDGGQWQKGESPIIYVAADSTLDDYHIFYSILWRGRHYIKEQFFYTDETKLNVEINQSDIVFPGANVPIEVKVTDYQNKGVEGANISAYSINNLFPTIPLPNLPYFGRLRQNTLYKFNVSQERFSMHKNDIITNDYINHFDLRKVPYYRFFYPENGVGIFQDTIKGEQSELAVYAHRMNETSAIRAVYINGVPMAIDGTSNQVIGVFSKPAGTYELKLRTNTHLYTIKNVKLIAGQKTYLCLNEAFIEGNPNVSYLKIGKIPFTKPEWDYFKSTCLLIKQSPDKYVLEQGGFVVDAGKLVAQSLFYESGYPYYRIGPFTKGKINVYNKKTDSISAFDFYPGFLYSIDSIGQIIVDKPIPDEPKPLKLGNISLHSDWNFNYQIPKWSDYLPDTNHVLPVKKKIIVQKKKRPKTEINYDNPAREQQLKSFRPETYGLPNAGGFTLKNKTGKTLKWVLLVNQSDSKSSGAWYHSHDQLNLNGITPGHYDIVMFFSDSSYALLPDFNILEKGTSYYRLDSNEVMPKNVMVQLKYEEIIIAANKSPLNTFYNSPRYFEKIHLKTIKSQKGETVLSGFMVNTYHQPLNQINLIFEKAGKFKYGALTNEDGYFELTGVEPGLYDIKIGNYLPYQVYESLMVKRGVNTRIVIGNDPALFLNKEGELVEGIVEEEPEAIFETVTVQTNKAQRNSTRRRTDRDYSAAAPLSSGSTIQRVSRFNNSNTFKWTQPITTIESTIYPSLTYQDKPIDNELEKYAKQKGMDKATLDLIRQNDSLNRIRNTFRDYGYWVPNIVTDANGNAKFTVQFPDNITRWKTIVPAMTGNKQTGIGIKYAQAFKPLSGHLGVPSFLTADDSIQLEGKILNYTNEALSAQTWFNVNDDTLQTGFQTTNRTISEKKWFSWPKYTDSLKLTYGLKMKDGYKDGEERHLKVLSNAIEQIKGELVRLGNDSVFSITPTNEKKSIYVYNQPLDIYQTEINKLKNFRYGCNEQTASKLKALLLEEKLSNALKKPFNNQKSIKTCIDILTRNQMNDGSYGWWGRGDTDLWVTAYVLDALNKASKSHTVGNFMNSARFLKANLPNMQVSDRLTALNSLAAIPFPMDYNELISGLDTINLSLQDSFKLIHLKQQLQDTLVSVDPVLASYIETNEGVFWGEKLFNYYINQWPTSALAYKILKQAGGHEVLLNKMRDYFLQLNPENRNTIERATLLELFLGDELLANETISAFNGAVWINNEKIDHFPYYQVFNANDSIKIKQLGTRLSVQINHHTMTENPNGNDSLLMVNTAFTQLGKETDSLTTGKPVLYTVNVNVKEAMKYVLLEIPIPASCIYAPKQTNRNRYESYRENFRHMTAISCATLPVGKHQFQIELIPRYEGIFKVVPTKVEEMYYPVNVNYSAAKKIIVNKP